MFVKKPRKPKQQTCPSGAVPDERLAEGTHRLQHTAPTALTDGGDSSLFYKHSAPMARGFRGLCKHIDTDPTEWIPNSLLA